MIETQAREDAIIKNDNLQALYTSENKELKDKIAHLNQDIDFMALNHAKSSTEKEEKIKHIQREAQEVREKLEAIQNIRKVSVEIQAKPEMKSVWVQTELTAEQIKQMEQSIIKYQNDIQKEQNKVQQKETELVNLRQQIQDLQTQTQPIKRELEALGKEGKETREQLEQSNKDLEGKVKDLEPNEAEKELLDKIGDANPTTIKNLLEKLQELLQNQQKISELTKKRDELQTQLDLATKTKEELATELNNLRTENKELRPLALKVITTKCLVADEIKDTDLSETILDSYFVEKLKEFMLEKDIKPETPTGPTEVPQITYPKK
ncbi:7336_t:CDS:2 [Scutellospora calospora]|uniref:7336_t:CDS:1 n=1 Tax=Scutellospora calospora TaxID=85575 RepID=A0ACA9K4P4_9GLOM|nr:7336_t:CDS:2 [Scutellospora calospora]